MIERIEGITPARFLSEYLDARRPVILRGLADEWRSRSWTPEYLKQAFGKVRISYEVWDGGLAPNNPLEFARRQRFCETTLEQFIEMVEAAPQTLDGVYGAALPFHAAAEELQDATTALDAYMGFPALYALRIRRRLKHTPLLWLGPAGTLSPLHFDKLDNFFFQVYGRKKWILVPPDQSDHVYWPCAAFGKNLLHWSPVDVEHPDFEKFPRLANARPMELVVEAGDVLFVPVGWWHAVRSIDISISLNFWWTRPLRTALALRNYFYQYARQTVLERFSKPIGWRTTA